MVAAATALFAGTAATAGTASTIAAAGTIGGIGAGTAASAATAGLFGAGGSITAAGVLSGVGTLFSGVSGLFGAFSDAAAYEDQAAYYSFLAKNEEIKGREEGAQIRRALAEAVATSNAVGGASGVDITSGSPAQAVYEASRKAERSYQVVQGDAELTAGGYRLKGSSARKKARSARVIGAFGVGDSLLDLADYGTKRGVW